MVARSALRGRHLRGDHGNAHGLVRCHRQPLPDSAADHGATVKAWLKSHWRELAGGAAGFAGAVVCPLLSPPYNAPCALVAGAVRTVLGG